MTIVLGVTAGNGARCLPGRPETSLRWAGAVAGCQAAAGTRALAMWLAVSWSKVASAAASSGSVLGRSGAISGRRTWS